MPDEPTDVMPESNPDQEVMDELVGDTESPAEITPAEPTPLEPLAEPEVPKDDGAPPETPEKTYVTEEQFDELRQQNRELMAQVATLQSSPRTTPEPEIDYATLAAKKPEVVPITQAQHEAMMASPEGFNAIIEHIVEAVHATVAPLYEGLNKLPDYVSSVSSRTTNTQLLVDTFFRDNTDLRQYENYIETLMPQVLAINPALRGRELLDKAGDFARTQLNLPKPGVTRSDSTETLPAASAATPAFPSRLSSPSRTKPEPLSEEQQDILSIL